MHTTLALDLPKSRRGASAAAVSRYAVATARVLLGLLFLVSGLNGFLNFLPQPTTPMPEAAASFAIALMKSGYMMQLVAATQGIVGALLLANRFVPLALVLLAPVVVNIVAFHVFLAPSGLPVAAVVVALESYLAWSHRSAYRTVVAARATVGA